MSVKVAYIKAVSRNFYINEVVPYISRAGRKMKRCSVVENGQNIYHSYSSRNLSDSQVVGFCLDRFKDYLLDQNYQGEIIIYLNSKFVGFDTRKSKGYFLSSAPNKTPQIMMFLRYLDGGQIDMANEIIRSLAKDK